MKNDMKKNQSRQRPGGREQLVTRGIGLPATQAYTLRASTSYSVNVAGVLVTHGIGCNTPFQPFRTVNTAVTPQYMTYLASAWDRVYVKGSRIKVELVNATMADSVFTVLAMDGNTSSTPDIDEMSAQLYSKSATLGYYSGGSTRVVLSGVFKPAIHLGVPATAAANACLGGDPPDPYFWTVAVEPSAGATGNVSYRVTVEYDLVFSELKAPSPA